jgi:hypothetical protein
MENDEFIIIIAQILLKYRIKLLGNLGHLGTKKDIYKQIFVSKTVILPFGSVI